MPFKDDDITELLSDFEKNPQKYRDVDDFVDMIDYCNECNYPENFKRILDIAEKFFPNHVEIQARKVIYMLYIGDTNSAKKILIPLKKNHPDEYIVLCALSTYYAVIGDWENNIPCIEQICQIAPDEPMNFSALAEAYFQTNKIDLAIENYKKCIQLSDKNEAGIYYNNLYDCYKEEFRYEESADFFKNTVDKNPYDYIAWVFLAKSYQGLNLYEKAIDALEYAISINDTYATAYEEEAINYLNLNEFEKSVEILHEGLQKVQTDDERVLLNSILGKMYSKKANYYTASAYYKKAIDIDPNRAKSYYSLAICYLRLSDFNSAEKAIRKATRIDPDNYRFYLTAALLYDKSNRLEQADNMFRNAIEIDPTLEISWKSYAAFQLQHELYEETIQTIEGALHYINDSIDLNTILATAYLKIGRKSESFVIIDNCCNEYGFAVIFKFIQRCSDFAKEQGFTDIMEKWVNNSDNDK